MTQSAVSGRKPPRPRAIPLLAALAADPAGQLSIAELAACAAPDMTPPIYGIQQCTKALHRMAARCWVRQEGYSRSAALHWMYRWEITPAGRDHLKASRLAPSACRFYRVGWGQITPHTRRTP